MLNAVGAEGPNGEQLKLVCVHWRTFPPYTAVMDKDVEVERKAGRVPAADYQKHLVWARICGLTHMDRKKCRHCPYVRHMVQENSIWVLRTVDGKLSVPIVDLLTMEILASRKRCGPGAPVRRTLPKRD